MTTETVSTLLILAIMANVVLMVMLLGTLYGRRRSAGGIEGGGAPPSRTGRAPGAASIDSLAASRIAASVAAPLRDAPARDDPASPEFASSGPLARSIVQPAAAMPAAPAGAEPQIANSLTLPRAADAPEQLAPDDAAPPDAFMDLQTGCYSRLAWDLVTAGESARWNRYGRPVTVAFVELGEMRRVTERVGPEAGDRLLVAIAETLRAEARASDHVARVGPARFAVLLPETEESQATRYVERVRAASDRWLAAGAVALRLSFGCASPRSGGDLDGAIRAAEERLWSELRRQADRSAAGAGDPTTRGATE